MIQKFELKWDIVTLYGMQTIKWPYPPVAGVWGRWWPDLLAQKKPGPGGTGQGEAPRAVRTWRLPSRSGPTRLCPVAAGASLWQARTGHGSSSTACSCFSGSSIIAVRRTNPNVWEGSCRRS